MSDLSLDNGPLQELALLTAEDGSCGYIGSCEHKGCGRDGVQVLAVTGTHTNEPRHYVCLPCWWRYWR